MIKILLSLIFAVSFVYIVGTAWVRTQSFSKIPLGLQKLALGLATIVVVMRIPYRENLPISMGVVGLLIVFVAGVFFSVSEWKRGEKKIQIYWLIWPVALLCILVNPLYPLIDGALYYYHVGPDLLGHLISASVIYDGQTYHSYMATLEKTTGTTAWWFPSAKFWEASDFRSAIAVEFMVDCLRYGHGVISTLISRISNTPIWFGMLVGICFSLYMTAIQLFYFLRTKIVDVRIVFCLVIGVCLSHSYLMMVHEGIVAQMYSLPLVTFLLLFNEELFFKTTKLYSKFLIALLLSALINLMSEAVPILLGFTLFNLLFKLIYSIKKRESLSILIKHFTLSSLIIAGFVVIINPSVAFDYVAMLYMRHQQGFLYSGFGRLDWDPLAILFSYPYLTVNSLKEMQVSPLSSHAVVLLELWTALLVSGYFCIVKNYKNLLPALSGFALLITVALTGVQYPLWKSAVILQPIILFSIIIFLTDDIKLKYKKLIIYIWTVFVVFSCIGLLNSYSKYSPKFYSYSFSPSNIDQFKGGSYAVVTPTNDNFYLALAASGPLMYVNSGWGPIYTGADKQLPLMLFYTCDIESKENCQKIQEKYVGKFPPNTLLPVDLNLDALLKNDGKVDQDKLKEFIFSRYGIGK